jgi:tRNA-dihydrouridine synthase B
MAGVTDKAFRHLCRELGAGYLVTEMLSCNPALRNTRKSLVRGDFSGEPGPVVAQIAGSEPEWMADTARYNVERGAQIIDINMGCPAKKVCRKLAGSALLSSPDQVEAILRTVVSSVDVPVTLKLRTGPDPANINAVTIARLAENCGIAALAIHGRTRADRFNGDAEYDTIADVCRTVSIPVFANGDITTPMQAHRILEHTGAAGLMIGRGAQGNPWIFREIKHYLNTGSLCDAPDVSEQYRVLRNHLQGLYQLYGEFAGIRIARKHLGWYIKAQRRTSDNGASEVLRDLMSAQSAAEQMRLVRNHYRGVSGSFNSIGLTGEGSQDDHARMAA